MKKYNIAFLFLCCFVFSINAQTLKQLIIESGTARPGVYAESCPSPSLGILVFNSAIEGLSFGLSMSNMLINQRYIRERNEYVLCVQPTERGIIVMINSRGYETATIRVEKIIASTPQFFRINPKETAWSITGREFNILGENALNNKNLPEAEQHFRNAVNADPNIPDFLYNLSKSLMEQDKFSEAVTFLQRVINIRPRSAEIHHMLGRAFFEQRRYTDAANSFKNALDIESNNSQYLIDFQKALNTNPDRARANFEIGNSYFDLSNYTEALKYYREAVRLDGRNAEYQARVRSAEITIQMQEIYRPPTQRDSYRAPTQIDSYRSPTRIEDY